MIPAKEPKIAVKSSTPRKNKVVQCIEYDMENFLVQCVENMFRWQVPMVQD